MVVICFLNTHVFLWWVFITLVLLKKGDKFLCRRLIHWYWMTLAFRGRFVWDQSVEIVGGGRIAIKSNKSLSFLFGISRDRADWVAVTFLNLFNPEFIYARGSNVLLLFFFVKKCFSLVFLSVCIFSIFSSLSLSCKINSNLCLVYVNSKVSSSLRLC